MGSKPVPREISDDEDKIMMVKHLYDAYGKGPKKETISLKAVSDVLCPLDSEDKPNPLETEADEEEFMVAFLIVVQEKLLCTTTNSSNLVASLIPCVTVATDACEYDWCMFSMEWLCDTAHRFQAKFLRDGFRSGSRGSFLFVLWGVFPRVKVWNSHEIRAAVMEDKLSQTEYGKLLALDLAYGEEHPLDPRDADCLTKTVSEGTQPQQVIVLVAEVLEQVMTQLTPRLVNLVEGLVGKAFIGFVTKMTTMGADEFVTSGNHRENAGSTGPRPSKTGW